MWCRLSWASRASVIWTICRGLIAHDRNPAWKALQQSSIEMTMTACSVKKVLILLMLCSANFHDHAVFVMWSLKLSWLFGFLSDLKENRWFKISSHYLQIFSDQQQQGGLSVEWPIRNPDCLPSSRMFFKRDGDTCLKTACSGVFAMNGRKVTGLYLSRNEVFSVGF